MLTVNLSDVAVTSAGGSQWTAAQMASLATAARPEAPIIGRDDLLRAIAGLTLWDIWPVQHDNGSVAAVAGGHLWVVLSAPRRADPDARHNEARLRLLHCVDDQWHDCGDLLPDGFSPGSREWSGSTRLDADSGAVTLWFTATGRRGETANSYEQRLFHATGKLDLTGPQPRVTQWQDLTQSVVSDGRLYADVATNAPIGGLIKGFRDPYWFRDPADNKGYLLFTGSAPDGADAVNYDGVIGIAAADDDAGLTFALRAPLVDASGLAHELELPHLIVRDGLYYLFWSTQAHVFAPDGPRGPTGLYGMVAPSLFGPYQPLNGSGLVLANPQSEPRQAYGWKVLPSLEVISFVDFWGLNGADIDADPALRARHFGGTIAPMVTIAVEGATTRIVASHT